VSTTALHVIELVKSLPKEDQQAIRDALTGVKAGNSIPFRKLQKLSDGTYLNPGGIPNDDPSLKILEEIEQQRHQTHGPTAPRFD
jgi:hypothetical protein